MWIDDMCYKCIKNVHHRYIQWWWNGLRQPDTEQMSRLLKWPWNRGRMKQVIFPQLLYTNSEMSQNMKDEWNVWGIQKQGKKWNEMPKNSTSSTNKKGMMISCHLFHIMERHEISSSMMYFHEEFGGWDSLLFLLLVMWGWKRIG